MTAVVSERRLTRALERLAGPEAVLCAERDGASFAVFPNGDRRRRPQARLSAAEVRKLDASGALARAPDGYTLSEAGRAQAKRAGSPDDPYLHQHGKITTRAVTAHDGAIQQARGFETEGLARRLGLLKDASGCAWFSAEEIVAAQMLRADWERSQAGLVRGSDWRGGPMSSAGRSANAQEAAMAARCDAERRFNAALDALAAPLRRVVERLCLSDHGFEALERAEHWPARSAKLALKLALAQLAAQRWR